MLSIAVVTVLEILSWIFEGVNKDIYAFFNYWSNACFLTLTMLPVAFGLKYIDYKIFSNKNKSKKRFFVYLIPTYINSIFLIINFFYEGFYFSVNDMNEYSRGIGVTFSLVVLYISILFVFVWMYKYKEIITGKITQAILTFFIVPVLGALLQVLAYGTTLGMPFYTLAIFAIFLLLEKDEMDRDKLTKKAKSPLF